MQLQELQQFFIPMAEVSAQTVFAACNSGASERTVFAASIMYNFFE